MEYKVNPLMRAGWAVAATVLVIDQASKWWVVERLMQPPAILPVTPFFNLVMGWNRGISFGLFDGASSWNAEILSMIALAIVVLLLVWLGRVEKPLEAWAIGLIVGGALGNVVDRVRYGAVADFLDFHVAGYHWPAFNAADAGITVGAAFLVADSLFGGNKRRKM